MSRAVIASVGGATAPVVNTLCDERPEFVCFLVSHASVEKIPEIKSAAGVEFTDEKVLVDDHEDLVGCYRQALDCLRRTQRRGYGREETVVDYTGGTKAMTAALAMAAASLGVRFSYVGGSVRSKDGLGIVEPGYERRRVEVDPLRLFAVEEKRRIALYFNQHQYWAAATALRELLQGQPEGERLVLDALLGVFEAYASWDRFDHAKAFDLLPDARRLLQDRARVAGAREFEDFVPAVEETVAFLGQLHARTGKFTRKDPALAADLLANADRRMSEGKFDDAVARLYRTTELVGQCAFERRLGVDTGSVPVASLPESLREEFMTRYSNDGVTARLPLRATFTVLATLQDPVGLEFERSWPDLQKVLNARNRSVLAHGTQPIEERTAARMREIIMAFLPPGTTLPRFPTLSW